MAVAGVLAFHALATTYHGHQRLPFFLWPVAAGKLGVDAFFVLSGFVITRSWGSRPTNFNASREFLSRRIKRLFPAYWASLAVFVALRARRLFDSVHGLGTLFLHVIGQQFLLPRTAYQINSVYWTLTPQIHFYLLFPLLMLAVRRLRARSMLIFVLVVSVGFRVLLHSTNQWPADTIIGRLDQFALGMAAALAIGRSNRLLTILRSKTVSYLAVGGLLALIFAYGSTWMAPSPQQVMAETFGHPLFAALLALRLLRLPETNGTSLATTAFAGLGTISYSVYLWHLPIFEWASGAGFVGIVAAIIASLIVGTISYFVLEKPSFRLRSAKNAARGDVGVRVQRDDADSKTGARRLDDLVRAGVDGLVHDGAGSVRDEEKVAGAHVA